MTVCTPGPSGLRRAGALVAATLAAVALGVVPSARADAAAGALPIGDADLTQVTTSRALADGVTLTRIVRGTEPAPADQINTTTRGPWVVNVLTIDPRRARGHLKATYGDNLGQVEKTTDLVRDAGALAGVNASFFTFTANPRYPGDPVGLGLYGGKLLGEPTAEPGEVNFVVDAHTNRALTGKLTWSGSVRDRRGHAVLPLEFINHPPVVPAGCAALTDQTTCAEPGDVVRFTPEFDAATPAGAGVEVVLDRAGCVVRTATTRGTTLTEGQTSVQATGHDTAALLELTGHGCLEMSSTVTDQQGRKLPLRPGLFGVNGRYPLTANGQIVVPDGGGDSFFARNPRTIAGTSRDGTIMLATIDGRQTTSVGTTLAETAAVAQALGMDDAINLDGGGSTTMAAEGGLVNHPSGAERAVGDALVYVPGRYR
ncbi:phosphodiester glycosidase family protein [Micromonospora sp. WMMD1120]|uniref:phosphodiester glycosidase family protein n=1 Tax=Micromonospora sp. WMMD1120 TaxID=3016106 RepID=UPI00241795AA|nr:phosphodiester glycosidase family protein [Micromonospora sp. WMMD1120]MDG4810882.1 phosphodiester glycosidase family protein [Micromonospora sp. WMMD1120]